MSTERSTFDELGRQSDVPSLGLPREQLLTYAMFARTAAGALRSARERHGRAAWNDADEAARIHLAADAAAIDELRALLDVVDGTGDFAPVSLMVPTSQTNPSIKGLGREGPARSKATSIFANARGKSTTQAAISPASTVIQRPTLSR